MGDDYVWSGSGAFNKPDNWYDQTAGQGPPAGPPDSSDTGIMDGSGSVSGTGDVLTLDVEGALTFTSGAAITAEAEFAFTYEYGPPAGTTVTIAGATLDSKVEVDNVDDTIDIASGGALITNTATDSGANVSNYGTISVNQGTITTDILYDSGSMLLSNGRVNATLVGVGYNSGKKTTLDVGSGSTISDYSGSVAPFGGDISSVTVHSGGVWTNSNDLLIGAGATAKLDISLGGSVSAGGGELALTSGIGSGGDGIIHISDGSLSITGDADIGVNGGTGTISLDASSSVQVTGTLTGGTSDIDVDGGVLTVGTLMMITAPAATLKVEAGGTLTGPGQPGSMNVNGSIDVNDGNITGYYLDAEGTVMVQNGTIAANNFLLGSNTATATATLNADGYLNSAITELAPETGDKGLLYVKSGGTLQASLELFVGDGGGGGLDIEGGIVKVDGGIGEADPALDAGAANAAAIGTVDVEGNGNMLAVTGAAVLGDAGTGSMLLGADANFSVAAGLYEGVQAGSGGSLEVLDGSLSIGGDWVVGDAGDHNDTIENGVSVSVGGTLNIARGGGTGALTITGSGSEVDVTGDVVLASSGTATLRVESSGSLSGGDDMFSLAVAMGGSGSVDIGSDANISVGTATIGASGTLTMEGGTFTASGAMSADGTVSMDNSASLAVGQGLTIGAADAGLLTIAGGSTVTASGALVIGAQSEGDGTITLAGAGVLAPGGDATIGDAGSGELDIGAASTVTFTGAVTLGNQAGSDGLISFGPSISLAPGGDLTVGNSGTGEIDLAAGVTLDGSAGSFVLGAASDGSGTIALAGGAAEVVANALTVGGLCTGLIGIGEDTTLDASGDLTLGATHGGGNGMVTVAGSGDLMVGGNLTVGAGGIGSLDVNGGALTIDGSFDIADGPASAGDVTFANSTLSIDTITVGNQGTATFSASQTAEVTATNIVLGQAGVGSGTFNLDGSGSQVQTSQLSVGGGGTGALQVTDSASFQVSGNASMGVSASSKVQETATISSNANWTIGGILDVGQKAAGQITIDGGGQVAAAQSVVIGDTTKASGTVTVSGTGTLPSALGFGLLLQVGNDGAGTLEVSAGAAVGTGTTDGKVEIGATSGASGLVSLTGTGSELQTKLLEVGGIAAGSGGTGTLDIASKAEVASAAATIWAAGTVAMSGGTLAGNPISLQGGLSGFGVVTGSVDNVGAILASGGTLELSGSITGDGGLEVSAGAELRLTTSVAEAETIGMASSGAILRLGKLAGVKATVTGFAQGDTIVLDGVTADGGDFSPGTLTLTEGGNDVGTLTMGGSYNSAEFHVTTVTGGSDVTIVPCFAAGTRILTPAGEVAVEALAPGDRVITRWGRHRPIKWIGHRRVETACHLRPQDVWPVRIEENAFAPGMPHRPLRLSPDHAIHLVGEGAAPDVLIPVRYLCNGATIRQESVAAVDYFHVELDAHDVLLAEGLPAESYLDTGNAAQFATTRRCNELLRVRPVFAILTPSQSDDLR